VVASVRNVDMRVGMNAERKADMVARMNMALANNKEVMEEEVTRSTVVASVDMKVDMNAERKANTEEETKMSTAVPVVMKVVIAEVTRTIIAVVASREDTVDKVKMSMVAASVDTSAERKVDMEEETKMSMVAASVDMSVERKVDMEEEEIKMSTVVPVDIRAIMEVTRMIIAVGASKEDTVDKVKTTTTAQVVNRADMVEVGISLREEAMVVVVDMEGTMTI
jgi:hypothetical protein